MKSIAKPKKLHIAFFPWLAFGHIIPFLNLAKYLAQKGHQISFISTPRNIKRLPKIPPHLSPLIKLVTLTLPYDEKLPYEAEATMDIPYHTIPYLKRSFDGLEEPLTQFLEISTPDWIIYDFAPHWLPQIALKLGISRAFYSIFNACAVSFFGPSIGSGDDEPRTKPEHFTVPPKWVPFPSKVAFRLYEAKQIFEGIVEENVSGVSDRSRVMSAILGCEVILIRTCVEIEGDWINLLRELHQKPVFPVGLVPPPPSLSPEVSKADDDDDMWQNILNWLDKQEKGRVVYIALGTEVTPSQKDFTELALGLELSGLPFFWALRKQHNSAELPEGFVERTKGRGLVWTSWAPQLRILAHESIGAFLTHCGWSSITEGLCHGRALIMLPFLGDQGLNARQFEEKNVGKEIERNEDDGSFTRESVAMSLRRVVLDEEGGIYREKAKEMRSLIGDKEQQWQYVDKFAEYLQMHSQI